MIKINTPEIINQPSYDFVLYGEIINKINAIIYNSFETGLFQQLLNFQKYSYELDHYDKFDTIDKQALIDLYQKSKEQIEIYKSSPIHEYYDKYLKSEIYPVIAINHNL